MENNLKFYMYIIFSNYQSMSLNYNGKPLFEKLYAVNGRLLKTPLTFEIIDENY